jgi:formylmethanofuran dehydrogenase subunit C
MSALTFTLREPPVRTIDCAPLIPQLLADKTPAEVAAIELTCGNRRRRVDSLFDISGDDAQNVAIRRSGERLAWIGKNLTGGTLTVEGDAGPYAGCGMRNGTLTISGNAGAWAASGLAGGELRIGGNAGDFLAGALPGDKYGMRGGLVIVDGDAGDRTADRMRRGVLLIKGRAGDYLASRMRAGTVMVLGDIGDGAGFLMKRGTLILRQTPQHLLPTFGDCGVHALAFLRLYAQPYGDRDPAFVELARWKRVRRHAGDLAMAGNGEILIHSS